MPVSNGCLTVHRHAITHHLDLIADSPLDTLVVEVIKHITNQVSEVTAVALDESTGRDSRRTNPDP